LSVRSSLLKPRIDFPEAPGIPVGGHPNDPHAPGGAPEAPGIAPGEYGGGSGGPGRSPGEPGGGPGEPGGGPSDSDGGFDSSSGSYISAEGTGPSSGPLDPHVAQVLGLHDLALSEMDERFISDNLVHFRGALNGKTTVYWSGSTGNNIMRESWEFTERHNFYSYPNSMDSESPNAVKYGGLTQDKSDQMQSAAMAYETTGRVYVFFPAEGLHSSTDFVDYEWPNLVEPANPNVDEIIWVDVTNEQNQVTIYRRGPGPNIFPLNVPVSQMGR
jgi:hypothetical protein